MVELGISTFGETTIIEGETQPISHQERLRNMMEEMKLADEVGLDIYAVGEHHREDFAVSAPEIVLAAGAGITKNIKLSSAVSVLSSLDPIRVYQQYATIDGMTNGRAEIMVGRGSFTESFPLFGYKLEDYEDLFNEKMDMLLAIKANEKLKWDGGKHTPKVNNLGVYPRSENMPIWVATGGNFHSTVKIAKMGLPITYAMIGGEIRRFKSLVDLYKSVGQGEGHSADQLKVASHSWGFIAETDEEAVKKYYHPTKQLVDAIAKDRPFWRPLQYNEYLNSVSDEGAMFVGSPETVAKKIISVVEDVGIDRFMLHLPVGSMKHEDVMKAIELFGKEVAPRVRKYFAEKEAAKA